MTEVGITFISIGVLVSSILNRVDILLSVKQEFIKFYLGEEGYLIYKPIFMEVLSIALPVALGIYFVGVTSLGVALLYLTSKITWVVYKLFG